MDAGATLSGGNRRRGRISVVVPVLNGRDTLQACLSSVSSQDYPDTELIVVDGGSTDGTVDLLRRNAIARWISEPDGGIYNAFNKGIGLSSGEWLLFLGSDDRLWRPDALSSAAALFASAGDAHRIVYGRVMVLDERDRPREVRGQPWRWYETTPRSRWTFEHQGVFHHISLFATRGLFDESFRICGDMELLLRELRSGTPLFIDGPPIAGFRCGGTSSQIRNLSLLARERRRAFAANGLWVGAVLGPRATAKRLGFEAIRRTLGLRRAERVWARIEAVSTRGAGPR